MIHLFASSLPRTFQSTVVISSILIVTASLLPHGVQSIAIPLSTSYANSHAGSYGSHTGTGYGGMSAYTSSPYTSAYKAYKYGYPSYGSSYYGSSSPYMSSYTSSYPFPVSVTGYHDYGGYGK